jgi:hypothetical protein
MSHGQESGGRTVSVTRATLGEVGAGGAIGLLLGLLTGLSASPVVGTVVAAIAALLGGMLGLTGGAVPAARKSEESDARAGHDPDARGRSTGAVSLRRGAMMAFGGFCVAGLLAGLAGRTHGAFSPTLKDRVARWTEAGYSPEQALRYTATLELGSASTEEPKGHADEKADRKEGGKTEKGEEATPGRGHLVDSALFADAPSQCERVSGEFADAGVALNAFTRAGAPWAQLAAVVRRQGGAPEAQLHLLEELRDWRCRR